MGFEERVWAVLPSHVSAYYAAPASSEVDLHEGTVEWSAIRFRPRVLRDLAP
jgi:isopentenyl diphosphate isomerase/L-lactate dehydrogenase-like FMN-dependent dehydrogenase